MDQRFYALLRAGKCQHSVTFDDVTDLLKEPFETREFAKITFAYAADTNLFQPSAHNNTLTLLGYSAHKLMGYIHKAYTTLVNNNGAPEPVITYCAKILDAASYILMNVAKNKNIEELFANGKYFECLVGLEYIRNGLAIIRRTSSSSSAHRIIRDLKPYVDAYATAILRMLLIYIDRLNDYIKNNHAVVNHDTPMPDKIKAAMCIALINYAAVRVKCSPIYQFESTMGHSWLDIANGLSIAHRVSQPCITNNGIIGAIHVRFNNNQPNDIINLLVEESNRLFSSVTDGGMYRCDTDYMTLRTVMPVERATDDMNIIDPSVSTTLRDHNELIANSFDTIPVPRTSHYVRIMQKEKAPTTEVSLLNISPIIEQCMSNTRADARFVEVHKNSEKGRLELNKFYSQACCVSPRNLGLFLRCLNFEMMDSDMFGATMQCLKMTKGIPTPRQEEIAVYSNTAIFRMAINLFYHTRFCRSYQGENTYMYDSRFFNDFLLWLQSPNYLEHQISPSVSSSIISWCTSMSTAMHTTADKDGSKCALASISTVEVDQRVLADFLNMFVKLFIEDETEISVINKKFLEKELLKAFATVSNCYNLFKGQFVSATALRIFLARCRWSVADDVEVIIPVETKFLNRLISDSEDMSNSANRDKLRKNMEDVAMIMAPLLSGPPSKDGVVESCVV
ncbi:hypothetical protein HPB47_017048 [Ixodes persulcatus]|uniref:Uncharacterized protein n=1 Tax=Ixodes persulcatus TaxID=34615 RepID=A0AC60QPF4_IXOPE|nr:hypothetical protein HPB47_017048 [Ixodes persulcatus]